ncbi:MAG TPA: hypothetical protein VN493_31840 [Thermoanaerobaculia bacterium]|nr:hypothetical protein [Thermoanaerobaculia bacterium]
MSRVKWVLVVMALVLSSAPAWAGECVAEAPSPFSTQIVSAVLHLPGPGEEPFYSSIQFAKAPPILPRNRCEAQCLGDFRQRQAECRLAFCPVPSELLLNLCAADCTDRI